MTMSDLWNSNSQIYAKAINWINGYRWSTIRSLLEQSISKGNSHQLPSLLDPFLILKAIKLLAGQLNKNLAYFQITQICLVAHQKSTAHQPHQEVYLENLPQVLLKLALEYYLKILPKRQDFSVDLLVLLIKTQEVYSVIKEVSKVNLIMITHKQIQVSSVHN